MTRTRRFKPYTHKDLGIPESIQIAGRTVRINVDSKIKGNAYYDTSLQIITIFSGNKDRQPTRERLQKAFMEEIVHWVIYITRFHKEDIRDGEVCQDEHFVGAVSEILFQVQKQLKDFTKNLESLY